MSGLNLNNIVAKFLKDNDLLSDKTLKNLLSNNNLNDLLSSFKAPADKKDGPDLDGIAALLSGGSNGLDKLVEAMNITNNSNNNSKVIAEALNNSSDNIDEIIEALNVSNNKDPDIAKIKKVTNNIDDFHDIMKAMGVSDNDSPGSGDHVSDHSNIEKILHYANDDPDFKYYLAQTRKFSNASAVLNSFSAAAVLHKIGVRGSDFGLTNDDVNIIVKKFIADAVKEFFN